MVMGLACCPGMHFAPTALRWSKCGLGWMHMVLPLESQLRYSLAQAYFIFWKSMATGLRSN
jgi:hypothetical protein